MNYVAKSEIGCKRAKNEDSYLVKKLDDGYLFLVCDGLGGHNSGDVASSMAVSLTDEYDLSLKNLKKDEVLNLLKKLFEDVNIRIYLTAKQGEKLQGMGTTYSLAISYKKDIYVVHMGDSRIYSLGKEINLLTEDHTYINELQKRGLDVNPNDNLGKKFITKALGTSTSDRPDIISYPKKHIKHLFMCSDGLTQYISDEELFEKYKTRDDDEKFVDELIKLCLERGGKDNITCIFTEIGE